MIDDSDLEARAPSRRKTARAFAEAPKMPASTIPPCASCRHNQRCALEQLACQALVLFMRVTTSPERLAIAPRQPTRELYERAHAPKVERPAPAVFRPPVVDDDEADVE